MTHTLADFFARALVWPDPDPKAPGWVNLHWKPPDRKGITGGRAFKTLPEILGFCDWSQTEGKPYVSDMYFCTSLQAEHGPPKQSGKYSALRSIDNAVSSKLLFADVDKYDSKATAVAAIKSFCERTQSPFPTALVDSGGGIHAYWVLPEALPPDQWLPLAGKLDGLLTAGGLKHDNITTDMARILRVPGTYNYKRGVPVPVVLKMLNGDVDLDAWKSLHDAVPVAALATPHRYSDTRDDLNLYATPEAAKQAPSRLFKGEGLTARIADGVVEPTPILKLCPLFAETLKTGGKDVGQPIWHQQALACTFLEGGRELFHNLGRQHPTYSREDSDEMFDRKIRDQTLKHLGYPSCAQFERDGAIQCKTCPIKGKVTSPLNITVKMLESEKKSATEVPFPLTEDELAEGYQYGDDEGRNGQFLYWKDLTKKNARPIRLFYSIFTKVPTLLVEEGADGKGMLVTFTSDRRRDGSPTIKELVLDNEAFANVQAMYEVLNKGGCAMNSHKEKVFHIMTTFRGRLMLEEHASRMCPYGWSYDEEVEGEKQEAPRGFSYAGTVYLPSGKTEHSYGADDEVGEIYRVKGSVEPWLEAVKVMQKSPGLSTVVLAAFAAPLMKFSGYASTYVMVRGDSGGCKSGAMYVSAAVWGEPLRSIMKPSASKLGVQKRTGRVRNMPMYWDDLQTDAFQSSRQYLMENTQGAEGLKLDQHRNERKQGTWDNMMVVSSNESFAAYLQETAKGNNAGLYRCFEFEVPKILPEDPAYTDPHYLAQLVASLNFNHGHLGREYAALLGSQPGVFHTTYKIIADAISKKVTDYDAAERYWHAAYATIIMALRLVNTLPSMQGAPFDEAVIEEFLLARYQDLRERMKEGTGTPADHKGMTRYWLSRFVNTYAAERSQVVWTADVPSGPGKPASVSPIWPLGDDAKRVKYVAVRWIVSTRRVRISKTALDKFLTLEKVPPDRIDSGLRRFYKATLIPRARMAAGLITVAAQSPEPVYEIVVHAGSELDQQLKHHETVDGRPKIDPELPERSPGPPAPHLPPEQTGPEDGTGAF